jgi:hypothetical protein
MPRINAFSRFSATITNQTAGWPPQFGIQVVGPGMFKDDGPHFAMPKGSCLNLVTNQTLANLVKYA